MSDADVDASLFLDYGETFSKVRNGSESDSARVVVKRRKFLVADPCGRGGSTQFHGAILIAGTA